MMLMVVLAVGGTGYACIHGGFATVGTSASSHRSADGSHDDDAKRVATPAVALALLATLLLAIAAIPARASGDRAERSDTD